MKDAVEGSGINVLEKVHQLDGLNFLTLAMDYMTLILFLVGLLCGILLLRRKISDILSRRTLRFNLLVLVIGSISTSAIVGAITEYYMKQLGENIEEIVKEDIALMKVISEIEVAQMHQSIWFERALLFGVKHDEARLHSAEEKSIKYGKTVLVKLDEGEKIAQIGVEKAINAESRDEFLKIEKWIEAIRKQYLVFNKHILEMYIRLNGGDEPTVAEIESLEHEEDELAHATEGLLVEIENFTIEAGLHSIELEKTSEFLILVMNAFSVLLLLLNSMIILSVISAKLKVVETSLVDNFGQLEHLSRELSRRSQSLSHLSQNQVSALNETAAAIQQVESTVRSNSSQAQRSESVSQEVRETAQQSNAAMKELMGTIEDIADGNKEIEKLAGVIGQIGEKTKVIDDIVFQTKLLSFNASVEAERAGEHGRGFAVVAQEVNNLAQMSGKAALEISDIVGGSLKLAKSVMHGNSEKVSQGQTRASETSTKFAGVLGAADAILSQSQQISSSSEEQSKGVSEINHAISSIQRDLGAGSDEAKALEGMCRNLEQETESIGETISNIQRLLNA